MSTPSPPSPEISVTILTLNSEQTLKAVLEVLEPFPEIVVLDNGSTDQTREIAMSFDNVQFYETPFKGFGELHNIACKLARFPWILSVDSDEILSLELVEEICSTPLDSNAHYAFRRNNHLNGKFIRGCGWSPDWVFRLFDKKRAAFDERLVHEKVCGPGLKRVYLEGTAYHEPYRSTGDFLEKMQRYSTLFAEQYRGKRAANLPVAICRGLWAFFRTYLLQRGFWFGRQGFVIAAYNGHTAYYKYLKLAELNRKGD